MQAIQFIKDHGVEKARKLAFDPLHPQMTHVTDDGRHWLNKDNPHCHATADDLKDMIVLTELKRIIESLDLVESWGGIEAVKRYDLEPCRNKPESAGYRLIQAIADYESIYGGEHV
ncbi:hypothetical protein [Acinetobacter courvalinii]|uniref:hypothetical protein n=1 Tax=Acinetobacter courvalinii TaxID=280147 RepID=UPI0028A25D38|nr:hypothetical protein [Acinetobacter courvalinii]